MNSETKNSFFWNDFPGMEEELLKVRSVMISTAHSENPIIANGLEGVFEGAGKMLRPALLLISSKFGRPAEKHYKLAAALELLHTATLIHDDVIDDSPLRRSLPALHTRFGKKDAVLIGDFLLSRCFILCAEETSPKNAVYIARLVSAICMMEIEQNNSRFKTNLSFRSYFRKISGKSALLFSAAAFIGAHEAKAPLFICEKLRRAAYCLGMAFQIIDDIIDYAGDSASMQKPKGSDVRTGLITLPLLCAISIEKTRNKDKPLSTERLLSKIFSQPQWKPEDGGSIFSAVLASGGIEKAYGFASLWTKRAERELSALPETAQRKSLEVMAKAMFKRKSA